MTDELTALKTKIDHDGDGQSGPSTVDVNRAFEIYDDTIRRLQNELKESNDALVAFDDELSMLEVMHLPGADLQAIIKTDHIVISGRHRIAIDRAKSVQVREPKQIIDNPGIHEKHVQGDEYVCLKCRKRWDIKEEEPVCEPYESE